MVVVVGYRGGQQSVVKEKDSPCDEKGLGQGFILYVVF